MDVIRNIEEAQKPDRELPVFRSGDRVKVSVRVVEGEKSRTQVFEGDVIARKGGEGLKATFTVRKISGGIGVERVPLDHHVVEAVAVQAPAGRTVKLCVCCCRCRCRCRSRCRCRWCCGWVSE